ncbi:hypothetical protein BDC45DRAFT_608244 [Circinella umbellata]|nr:hypothetical protein BDC45DRAFT_608244 [Circinella umbellata]
MAASNTIPMGIIKNNKNGVEVLVAEVSSSFGSDEAGKVGLKLAQLNGSPIHRNNTTTGKAMFGTLSMVRSIAQSYNKAKLNTFKNLNIRFLLGHGTAVQHWTVPVQAPNILVMNKKQRVEVPIGFSSKDLHLNRYIEFYKNLSAVFPTLVSEQPVEQNTSVGKGDAVMSLVTGCTLVLQWNIDEKDLTNINL